ncbi:hypothetical protein FGO68_gene8556 [Halteria grandinella]|uniref:Transmembrane protein n=1 Tax=Halteria grandinella TaxID=5974 RepID=A0A8J8P1N1_HALGN|nr:hypothetical protein FGO68_gene8556 [Halteria grandinella]
MFNVLMVLRRLVFALSVVLLEDHPYFQINLYQLSSFFTLIYLSQVGPFESNKFNFLELFNELNVFIASFHLIALVSMGESDDNETQKAINKLTRLIGNSFIGFSIFQISVNLLFILSDFFSSLCKLAKKVKTLIVVQTGNLTLTNQKAKIENIETFTKQQDENKEQSEILNVDDYTNLEAEQSVVVELKPKQKLKINLEFYDPFKLSRSNTTEITPINKNNHIVRIPDLFSTSPQSPQIQPLQQLQPFGLRQLDQHFLKTPQSPLPYQRIQLLQNTQNPSIHRANQSLNETRNAYDQYSMNRAFEGKSSLSIDERGI